MSTWQPYSASPNTVTGDLRVWPNLYSPQLDNRRDVFVWLPPDYESAGNTRRYPVIYMHDAQNLFDKYTSYAGEWEADETMTALAAEGLSAILVGLPNMAEQRPYEYCPYPLQTIDGRSVLGQGDQYARFLIETVKPLIDESFRTLPDAASTGIAGSSMGGLISLYAFVTFPAVFGLCGAFSTAYWFGNNSLLSTVHARADGHGRIYLDVGTSEGETVINWLGLSPEAADAAYCQGVRDLRDALLERGYTSGQNLMYIEAEGALHREHAWAVRMPAAMRFLLAGTA